MARRPLVVAHRGGAALRPENTLAAIAHAVGLGVDAVEVDVHLSADGKIVVHHNYRLNNDVTRLDAVWLTGTGPLIRDLAMVELSRLDVGRPRPDSPYAKSHPDLVAQDGARIPLLDDVVALLGRQAGQTRLMIELKLEPLAREEESDGDRLIEATAELLERARFVERSIIISFDWRALRQLARRLPTIRIGYLTYPFYLYGDEPLPADAPAWTRDARRKLRMLNDDEGAPPANAKAAVQAIAAARGFAWGPFHRDASPDAIAAAHGAGLKVNVWTANEQHEFAALVAAGVDGIATDRPDRLIRFLADLKR